MCLCMWRYFTVRYAIAFFMQIIKKNKVICMKKAMAYRTVKYRHMHKHIDTMDVKTWLKPDSMGVREMKINDNTWTT